MSTMAVSKHAPRSTTNELGDFLRAHRTNLTPERVRVAVSSSRRVSGLLRHEVASLAGVSEPYYQRLEQGRAQRPSSQVVAALGRALQLSKDELAHLYRLAGHDAGTVDDARPDATTWLAIEQVFSQLHESVAYVAAPNGRVLLATDLAKELCPGLVPGVNSIVYLFLDEDAARRLPDIGSVRRDAVARLRYNVSGDRCESSGLDRLVDSMVGRSREFRLLWKQHEVMTTWSGPIRFRHEAAGKVSLSRVPLMVGDSPAYRIHLLHPADAEAKSALARVAIHAGLTTNAEKGKQ